MTLHIKHMVCPRCIAAVKDAAVQAGLQPTAVRLGEVDLEYPPTDEQLNDFDTALVAHGFERIENRKLRLVEAIKAAIISLIHHSEDEQPKENLSHYLAGKLHHDYTYLSNLFSAEEDATIEHYYIAQKIERVKELLTYDEWTLSEIAWRMGYSSTAHLSTQFKKVTGMTPSAFKNSAEKHRHPLTDL